MKSTLLKKSRTSIKILTSVILIYFFIYKNINNIDPAGYCRTQNNYVSDADFSRTAAILVKHDIKRKKPTNGDSSLYGNWGGYIPNEDDPDCCKVNRKNTIFILNRILNLQTITVHVLSPKPKHEAITFEFDVCGKLLDSDIGFSSSTSGIISTNQYRR